MIAIMSPELTSRLGRLAGRDLEFAPGAAVFHRGDAVHFVHMVRAGVIHLVRHQANGAALTLQRAASGSILAEASVYSDSYHCDARAETPAATRAIARETFLHALAGDAALALEWTRHLANEVQRARLHAEILSLRTVAARLDAWLAWNRALPRKGLWANVAHEISVSPEALYREVARRGRAPA